MTATIAKRKTQLEAAISKVAGFPVEITIRGEHEFTWSAEGRVDWAKAKQFLLSGESGHHVTIDDEDYDEECDQSCLWFTAK